MQDSRQDSGGASPPTAQGNGPRHFGKYRGTVIDNIDPMMQARLLCLVPAFTGMTLNWAMPCVPYAGLEVGFFSLPPIGANVWIEFEGGRLDFPIWSGCFWEEFELPPEVMALAPEDPSLLKVWKTSYCTLIMNDTPGEGGITLSVIDAAVDVPITLTFTSLGVKITTGPTTITMSPEEGITLLVGESTVNLTEAEMSVETPDVSITANVDVKGAVEIKGNMDVTGAVEIKGAVDVTGAMEISGDTGIGGALHVEGESNFVGEVTCEGAVNITGACTVTGAADLLGVLAVEGESNFTGLVTIEGDVAVFGVIEGVVMPPL